jgi:hypothetical protein
MAISHRLCSGKETFGVVDDFQIIPTHAGHILANNHFGLSRPFLRFEPGASTANAYPFATCFFRSQHRKGVTFRKMRRIFSCWENLKLFCVLSSISRLKGGFWCTLPLTIYNPAFSFLPNGQQKAANLFQDLLLSMTTGGGLYSVF